MEAEKSKALVLAVKPEREDTIVPRKEKAGQELAKVLGLYEHIHGQSEGILVSALLDKLHANPNARADELAEIMQAGQSLEDPDQISRLVFGVSDTLVGRVESKYPSSSGDDEYIHYTYDRNTADIKSAISVIGAANGYLSPVAARAHLAKPRGFINQDLRAEPKFSRHFTNHSEALALQAHLFAVDIGLIEQFKDDPDVLAGAVDIAKSTNPKVEAGIKSRAFEYVLANLDGTDKTPRQKLELLQAILETYEETPDILASGFVAARQILQPWHDETAAEHNEFQANGKLIHDTDLNQLSALRQDLQDQKAALSAQLVTAFPRNLYKSADRRRFEQDIEAQIHQLTLRESDISSRQARRKGIFKKDKRVIKERVDAVQGKAKKLQALSAKRVIELSLSTDGQEYIKTIRKGFTDSPIETNAIDQQIVSRYVDLVKKLVANEQLPHWVDETTLASAHDFLAAQGVRIKLVAGGKKPEVI